MTQKRTTKSSSRSDSEQSARFIEAARELGCNESPDAFEAAVKKVARHKPVEDKPAGAPSTPDPASPDM